jgi:hypothetical protein
MATTRTRRSVNAITTVAPVARSRSWHCASALGGASRGQPARLQSSGQRGAATIGVIQMSPKRKPARDRHRDRSDRPLGRRRPSNGATEGGRPLLLPDAWSGHARVGDCFGRRGTAPPAAIGPVTCGRFRRCVRGHHVRSRRSKQASRQRGTGQGKDKSDPAGVRVSPGARVQSTGRSRCLGDWGDGRACRSRRMFGHSSRVAPCSVAWTGHVSTARGANDARTCNDLGGRNGGRDPLRVRGDALKRVSGTTGRCE